MCWQCKIFEILNLSHAWDICFSWTLYQPYAQNPILCQMVTSVNYLNFWTLVICQKVLDKQCRPRSDCFWWSSLIRVFPVCYSDKHFMNSSPEKKHLLEYRKRNVFEILEHLPLLSRDMRFSTMWYVRPAKAQTSLRIRAVWSDPLLVAWIIYRC